MTCPTQRASLSIPQLPPAFLRIPPHSEAERDVVVRNTLYGNIRNFQMHPRGGASREDHTHYMLSVASLSWNANWCGSSSVTATLIAIGHHFASSRVCATFSATVRIGFGIVTIGRMLLLRRF
jgi:hypothetical protein